MLVLGMAGLFNDFVMPAAWAGCMDVGGRYAGTVSGAMNMMGSIAGALSPLVVGYLLAWTGAELDADLLRLGRDLQPRRDLLAVPRRPHADRGASRGPTGGVRGGQGSDLMRFSGSMVLGF